MKRITILSFVMAMFAFTSVQASNADLFSYDATNVETEFAQLNELEAFVTTNDVTFESMAVNNQLSNFNVDWNQFDQNASPMFSFDDIDWGAFFWGFCCWPVGIFTVLLNGNKDSDSKISYFIGLGVSLVLGAIGGGGAA